MDTLALLFLLLLTSTICTTQDAKTKRQIFREQVLPHSGGKIPESAFRSDRLALNKLQKLGVAVPDGVSFDTRSNSVVRVAHDPETEYSLVRILQEDEGRYVPPEGRSYPSYPRTVQSTYLIRPPIGSYHVRPHIHRAVQGPPLSLHGASIEATAFQNNIGDYQNLHRTDLQDIIPAPTPSPDHAQYVARGGLNSLSLPSPTADFVPANGYNNLYSQLLSGYTPSGLLRLNSPYRIYPYSFLNYPSAPYSSHSFLNPDDLSYRLRRRVSDEGNHVNAASESHPVTVTSPKSDVMCTQTGREVGAVFSDPNSACKKQYICLEDGRAAAYVCPEGSVFSHRLGKCETKSIRRRRVKLDSNCNPL